MRHPKAKLYVDFGDFSFWQLQAQHVHFNGGFAKAAQLRGDELSYNGASIMSLAAAEAEIIESLNQRYNGQFHLVFGDEKAKNSSKNYKIISFDLDGVDFMSGEDIQRQSFANKITKAEQLEDELKLIFEKAIGSN
jgi:putative heme iron utilization protein